MNLLETFQTRGMVAQSTHPDEIRDLFASGEQVCLYTGFDPTADSLHVGHLIPVMGLAHAVRAGHHAIALVGGGTALIGDPTGKTDMRKILTAEDIGSNLKKISKQLHALIQPGESGGKIEIVNNLDWLAELNYLKMLREVGAHFSVNRMLSAECFKQRLESGLSFLEFNYMILQAYDFLELQREKGCVLQLGGDDQWSNMIAGVELIRRTNRAQAFAMTYPLLTTSDGKKMGKTEKGAVWLDPQLTSPYEYFQYWRNIPDDKVAQCLALFTFLDMDEVNRLASAEGAELNFSKQRLAFEATRLLHGEQEAEKALEAAKAAFGGGADSEGLPTTHLGEADIAAGKSIVELLKISGFASSTKEARRLVEGGGIYLNGERMDSWEIVIDEDRLRQGVELRKGKKHFHRIVVN